jgi:hypothetical protein
MDLIFLFIIHTKKVCPRGDAARDGIKVSPGKNFCSIMNSGQPTELSDEF